MGAAAGKGPQHSPSTHLQHLPLCLTLCVLADHDLQLQRLKLQGALDVPLHGKKTQECLGKLLLLELLLL